MEFTIIEGLRTLKLDLVMTLALAAVFLFIGGWLQRRVKLFSRSSIPAAAIGGLLFATLVFALRRFGTLGVSLDTSLRAPLQTAFFTTIGFGATLQLLRAGGARMIFFFLIASLLAVVQNVAGIGVAVALHAPPALGIICGSLTLTGGPATGLAFTSLFEQKGIAGAGALIIASATFGIFVSSLVGNPVATWLIRRRKLATERVAERIELVSRTTDAAEEQFWAIGSTAAPDDERAEAETEAARLAFEEARATTPGDLLRSLLFILVAMGAGALLSLALTRTGVVLPGYIGAMIVAAVWRNFDDTHSVFKFDPRAIDTLGTIALALFLVIALMDLKLWQLAGLAAPMLIILAVQIVLMILYAVAVTFVLMGRDYEAAVTASGHVGFGLGITPNAVANMEALVARFGPAPRSFLVVPVVGAFFIDFSNALVIVAFANFIK
ncbi:MAG: glutamate:Na+ symporter, family [Acidobacteriota bacterium]|nr:glutamate:Na+ symporter, family [Acidobacteriota bacterium]